MKKVLFGAAALALLSGAAFAQGNTMAPGRADTSPGQREMTPGQNPRVKPPGQSTTAVPPGHTFNTPGQPNRAVKTTGTTTKKKKKY